jgi:hypothetical protein
MQDWAQKMRRLTVNLSIWSTTTIVDGGELGFADSGEFRREENHEFAVLPPPLQDSFEMKAPRPTADLLNHSMVQEMI